LENPNFKGIALLDKEKFATYLWFGPFYFFSVGVLYLWGYWPNFKINIFEYVALTDVVKVAIIPVGSFFVFIFLGLCLGEATTIDVLPEGGGKGTRLGLLLNKIKWILIIIYAAVLFVFIFYPIPNKWLVLPMLLLWPFYFPLKKAGFLKEIRNDSIRSLLIAATVLLPFYSYAVGKINASGILQNTDYQYTVLLKDGKKERFKFLGYANQYVFFISMNNQELVISEIKKVSPLYLHAFKPTKQGNNAEKPNPRLKKGGQSPVALTTS